MIPKRHLIIFSIRKDFFQAFDFFPSFEPQWWSNCPNMSSVKVDNSYYDSLGNPSYIFHQVLKGRTDTIMFFFCFYVVLLGRLSLTLQKGGSIWGTFLRGQRPSRGRSLNFDSVCTENPIKSWLEDTYLLFKFMRGGCRHCHLNAEILRKFWVTWGIYVYKILNQNLVLSFKRWLMLLASVMQVFNKKSSWLLLLLWRNAYTLKSPLPSFVLLGSLKVTRLARLMHQQGRCNLV